MILINVGKAELGVIETRIRLVSFFSVLTALSEVVTRGYKGLHGDTGDYMGL